MKISLSLSLWPGMSGQVSKDLKLFFGLSRSIAQGGIGALPGWGTTSNIFSEVFRDFMPMDGRFDTNTITMQDKELYKAEGIPPGATQDEIAKYFREIGWPAIPQRRQPGKSSVVWWLSAASAPKEVYLRWGGANILVTPVSEEERNKPRNDRSRNGKGKAQPTALKAVTENSAPAAASRSAEDKDDKLAKKDPWADWLHSSGSHSSSGAAVSRPPSKASQPPMAIDLADDPRIAALTTRLEKVEIGHANLEHKIHTVDGKVQVVDGKLNEMNTSMAEQFQQVLGAIAGLHSLQDKEGKRQRTEEHS